MLKALGKIIKQFPLRFVETWASIGVGLVGLAMVAAAPLTSTPTQLAADDSSLLRAQLLSTATTATLDPQTKWVDGEEVTGCFDSPKAFILIEDSLGRKEWASYGSKSCSADFVTTLTDMRRGLSPVTPGFGTGTGLDFDAGSSVKVVDYPLLYNNSLKTDQLATLNGSGAIKCGSTAQPCTFTTAVTTAQRDAFSFGTGAGYYPEIFNTTTNTRQYWNGSSWINYGSGSTVNATTTIRGAGEVGTTADVIAKTINGDSGAPVLLPSAIVTRSSTGATQANKVAALDAGGRMSGSLLGSGTPSNLNFLRGDQTWGLPAPSFYFGTSASGNVIVATGTTLTLNQDVHYNNLTIYSGATIAPNGYRVFVAGTLLMKDGNGGRTGIIEDGGNATNASGTTPGVGGVAAHGTGTLTGTYAGKDGGAGGASTSGNCTENVGQPGVAGLSITNGIGLAPVAASAGGAGGDSSDACAGSGQATGGIAGTIATTTITNAIMMYNAILPYISWDTPRTFSASATCAGSGGGASGESNTSIGGSNTGEGGGGGGCGANGGNVDVYAATLSGSGTISVRGGNGSNGAAGTGSSDAAEGCGGGGAAGPGGNGGAINILYRTKAAWTGIFTAAGGSPGTPGAAGTATCTNDGTIGSTSNTGNDGVIFQFQVE